MNHAMTLAALLGAFAQDLPGLSVPEPAEPRRNRSRRIAVVGHEQRSVVVPIKTEAKAAARRRRQMQRAAAKKQEASNG